MRFFSLSILTLLLFSFVSACRSGVDRFLFLVKEEKKISLSEDPGKKPEEEGIIDASPGPLMTPRYRLSRPVQAENDGAIFYIRYRSDLLDCSLNLFDEEEELIAAVPLPNHTKTAVTFRLQMPAAAVAAFSVESSGKTGRFQILEAGTSTAERPEIIYRRDNVTLYDGMAFSNDHEGAQYHFRLINEDTQLYSDKSAYSGIRLSLDLSDYFPEDRIRREGMTAEDVPSVMLTLRGEGGASRLRCRLPPSNKTDLYLYRPVLGFLPEEVSVTFTAEESPEEKKPEEKTEGPAVDADGGGPAAVLKFRRLLRDDSPSGYTAIPADLTSILEYAEEGWRRDDFEIFSWNLYPQILIIDTADYAVQSSMFKRLAFFVEKKGFTGELHPNRDISHLHGWNAHDYRAEDLAEFFNRGAEENFVFNDEEIVLKNILLENSILKSKGAALSPASGGVLSISRQSFQRQRLLLLRHEALHGVYFATPEFQREVKDVWDALSSEEQWFWRLFLGWMQYETDHSDLTVNEFMAYHLQQDPDESDYYLGTVIAGRLIDSLPALSGRIAAFINSHPATFRENSRELSEILYKYSGLLAGRPDSLQIIKE